MEFKDLDPELRTKLKECKTPGEVAELAKSVGIPLTDEQLDSISGGAAVWSSDPIHTEKCKVCGATIKFSSVEGTYWCQKCGQGHVITFGDGTHMNGPLLQG